MTFVRASIIGFIGLLALPPVAEAAQIKLLSSNAVRQAYAALIPAFEKQTGHHVTAIWADAADLKNRVNGGAEADLIIAPSADIDELVTNGKVVTGTRIDVAKSQVGVAFGAGAPSPAYAGPLPADLQLITVFSSGILNTAPEPDAAEELVRYLNSATAIPALRQNGLEPAS